MTLETASFAEGAIEVTFLQQQGPIRLRHHPNEPRRLETLQIELPDSSVKRNQRSISQYTTFGFMTRRRQFLQTDCDRKHVKVFAYGLPMTMPQTGAETSYPRPPHRNLSLTKSQLESTASFVLSSISHRLKVLPAIKS